MKNRNILLPALIATLTFCSLPTLQAQESDGVQTVNAISTFSSLDNSDFQTISVRYDFGVSYKRWCLTTGLEAPVDIVDKGETVDYQFANVVSTSLSYDFLKFGNGGVLDLRARYGGTTSKNTWNYQFCDLGITLSKSSTAVSTRPFFGMGARYYDFKTSALDDMLKFYISFGFRF